MSAHSRICVTLTEAEQLFAAQSGAMRRLNAIKRRRNDRYGSPKPEMLWGIDIEAAAAELAVAKYVGMYWQSVVDDPKILPGDVGKLQVRHTTYQDGRLMIYASDKDEAPFILVRGQVPTFELAGWLYARDGKQDRYLKTIREGVDAYYIPADHLRSIGELKALAWTT